MKSILNRVSPMLLTFLLAFLCTQAWLGTRGINEPDEGRYAEISREMALQSDWLVPHQNGVPHFQKPPLTYWLTAISLRLFGVNEYAARLPVALAALGIIVMAMYMARILFNPGAGWMAGLILLSGAGFFAMAHLLTTDMFLTLCVTMAMAGFISFAVREQKIGLLVFYVSIGLGFLAKGPIVLIFTLPAPVCWQITTRRKTARWPRMFWLPGLIFALGLGLSWFFALFRRYPDLFDYFFKYEFVDRIASNVHHRARPIWYYTANLIVMLLPWSFIVPHAIRSAWKQRRALEPSRTAIIAGWTLLPLIALHLITSKIATYLLPILPGVAVMLAGWLSSRDARETLTRPLRIAGGFFGLLFLFTPLWMLLVAKYSSEGKRTVTPAFWIMISLSVVLWLMLAFMSKDKLSHEKRLALLATGMLCMLLALISNVDNVLITGNSPVRGMAERIKAESGDSKPVVMACGYRAQSLSFYLQRTIYRSAISSDIVLPLEGEALRNCITNENAFLETISGTNSFVLVKKNRIDRYPPLADWTLLETHRNRALLRSPGKLR